MTIRQFIDKVAGRYKHTWVRTSSCCLRLAHPTFEDMLQGPYDGLLFIDELRQWVEVLCDRVSFSERRGGYEAMLCSGTAIVAYVSNRKEWLGDDL